MSTAVFLVVVSLGFTLVLIGAALAWRRTAVRPAAGAPARRATKSPEPLEAAPASEAIEEMVNRRLAEMPEMAGARVDFGTAADGSLEIWVGEERYASVDQVRDPRIRQAIQDAVAAYNK
jgi:hypothetical protein